jgi:hypothetical protein
MTHHRPMHTRDARRTAVSRFLTPQGSAAPGTPVLASMSAPGFEHPRVR